jgi:hypothetical protein
MNLIQDRYQSALRPAQLRFRKALGLFLIAALACISQLRTSRYLEHTRAELTRARTGLARVRQANQNASQDLAILRAGYTQSAGGQSAERLIYGRIDELKSRFRPDELSISALERKGGELSLQYSLRFDNPDYDEFLNLVSYLELAAFPFSPVDSVTLTGGRANQRKVLSCTVSGKLLASAGLRAGTPERP